MVILRDDIRNYSKGEIDRAGKALITADSTTEERILSIEVLNNYRACHSYPINTFQSTLRYKLKSLNIHSITSQRLKRIPSILFKLDRIQGMRLSRMQDIGGLRAVVNTISDVYKLKKAYDDISFQHELISQKDYIQQPKESGYRSLHMVYKYYKPGNHAFNGLMVELQIRTRLQHSWATAVETVGAFIDQSLKSSQGSEDWLNFFKLVANAFTYLENTNPIPQFDHLNKLETYKLVASEADRLQVVEQLSAFSMTVRHIETDRKQGSIYLLTLDLDSKSVYIKTFSKSAIKEANDAYTAEETVANTDQRRQIVLVTSDSIDSLKKAYPSYFLDTNEFLRKLQQIIKSSSNPTHQS